MKKEKFTTLMKSIGEDITVKLSSLVEKYLDDRGIPDQLCATLIVDKPMPQRELIGFTELGNACLHLLEYLKKHGIPKKIQSQIFDSFFTTKTQGEGTGLGLYITKEIVQKHHGTIHFNSEPGNTVFEVMLPITQTHRTA